MKSLTLNDILFPVHKSPIYIKNNDNNGFKKIAGKTAIINSRNDEIISVVSNGYEIITNEEAYNYGESSFKSLFKTVNEDRIEVFNIISPESKSFCHIDLRSKDKKVDILGNEYFPFVRITNSYNAMYRLYFRIGICRWICKNGMIFGEEAIKLSYIHSKGAKERLKIQVKPDLIDNILNKFKTEVETLQQYSCEDKYKFPLFLKALGIDPSKQSNKEENPLKIEKIQLQFEDKLSKYEIELGKNFYALYNVITEFGTFGFNDERMLNTKINSRQTRTGGWIKEISELLTQKELNYEEYLEDYLEAIKN